MGKIRLLDCTLRDGGYCNQWNFGQQNIRKIIMGLEESGIEIIECGFLNGNIQYNKDCTRFCLLEQAERLISQNEKNTEYVCMLNYGDIDINLLPEYRNGIIDGIRVAFHKEKMNEALAFCRQIGEKGYKVYIQPMVILDYSDEEFLSLLHKANEIQPYAFYIVDSFGVMKKKQLIHIYYMTEHNLNENICIGFHSHNNMQLSYSNAQELLTIQGNREVIIDCSIFGMGRGAGNLNTELFEQYLNDNYNKEYNINPLLTIYDEILSIFYNKKNWGYSLDNYLSATYDCHPNYATFLSEKNTLSIGDMDNIFQELDSSKKNMFDKGYIELLYQEYMGKNRIWKESINEFKNLLRNRKIMIIASGRSSILEKDKIIKYIQENNCLVISINAEYYYYNTDYVFVSNIRRYKQIDKGLLYKMIVTSNILTNKSYLTIDYDRYTNSYEHVTDNAILMLLKYLEDEGVKEVAIAGLDGYSHDLDDNYADDSMIIKTSNEIFDRRNEGINCFIKDLSKKMQIHFVTKAKYICNNDNIREILHENQCDNSML